MLTDDDRRIEELIFAVALEIECPRFPSGRCDYGQPGSPCRMPGELMHLERQEEAERLAAPVIEELRASRVRVGELEAQVETAERQRDALLALLWTMTEESSPAPGERTPAAPSETTWVLSRRVALSLAMGEVDEESIGVVLERVAALDTPPAKEAT